MSLNDSKVLMKLFDDLLGLKILNIGIVLNFSGSDESGLLRLGYQKTFTL